MKPLYKGLLIALLHILIVSSLGGKLLYDRATRPRVWVKTRPYDPDLPIRGRYVRLRLEGNKVVQGATVVFFIPEHVKDPSRRATGEELWVEVTLPKKGPPRPIRLGVKKDGGEITPLELD